MSFQDSGLFNPNPTPTGQPQQPPSGPGEAAPPPQLVTPPPQPQPQPPPDQPPPETTGRYAIDTGGPPPGDTGDQADMPGWWRQQPQPPSIFMPYAANRGPTGWGKPWWPIQAALNYPGTDGGPYMPSPWEHYGVIAGSGGQLSRWGSEGVAPYAGQAAMIARQFAPILDMISRGAFSRNFNAAQLQSMRLQQEQMYQASEQAYRRHQYEAEKYGEVLEQARLHAISPDEARRKIEDLTWQFGDANVRTVLHNKDLGAVEKYLDWTDAKARDMYAGTVSGRKATGGGDVEGIKTALGETGDSVAEGQLPIKQAAWEQAAPKGLVAQAPKGPETPAAQTGDEFNDQLTKQHGLTPQELDIARGLVAGSPSNIYGDLAKAKDPSLAHMKSKIDQAADAINNRTNQVLRDKNQTADQKLNDLDKTDPDTADLLRGLNDYSIDPHDAGRIKDRARAMRLMHSLNPNWKEGNYRIVQKYHDGNTYEGRTVQRVSSLDGALWSLNNTLQRIPENQSIPRNVMEAWFADHYSGDPKWDELYTAIRDVATDTVAIQTGTGRPAVSLVNAMVHHMLATNSPAQIRAQVLVDMRASYGNVKTLVDQYRSEVGDQNAQLPFFGRDVQTKYEAWLRMNPYTGEMPADAPASIRGVGKPVDRKNLPSWIERTTPERPGQDLPPLTKGQIVQGWDKLDELSRLNDPESQRQAQWLRQRLGMFADRGSI